MTFKEHLDYVSNDRDFYFWKAYVALELDAIDDTIEGDDFEMVCSIIYDIVMKYDGLDVNEIARYASEEFWSNPGATSAELSKKIKDRI